MTNTIKAKNRATGEVREFRIMKDFFPDCNGYFCEDIDFIYTEDDFNSEWEVINKNTQNVDIEEQDVNKTDIESIFREIKDYDFKENHHCGDNDGESDCQCFIQGLNVALTIISKYKNNE